MPLIGEFFAVTAAFCYAFGSVAATMDARENGGRGTAVVLSIALTAVFSGTLWLLIGEPLPDPGDGLWRGVAYFCTAGLLATVLGRVLFFRSIELTGSIESSVFRRLIPVFATGLAVVFLGETITPLIALAFALVFSGIVIVLLGTAGRLRRDARNEPSDETRDRSTGRLFAGISAASYGGAYVTRKFGISQLSDPLVGTFVGAAVGLVFFAVAARFSGRYRHQLASLFTRLTLWRALSAGAISLGQIAQFTALKFTSVTSVAIISSVEMFFAAWLAGFAIRSEPKPGLGFLLASILSMTGVVLLALASADTGSLR